MNFDVMFLENDIDNIQLELREITKAIEILNKHVK